MIDPASPGQWERVVEVSALPQSFDFVTARCSTGSVLVTRDAAGALHVLSNTCPHQRATVCREPAGRAEHFECPNHYWLFAPDGRFLGSRLSVASGRAATDDPSKDLTRADVTVTDGWVMARFS
ncbi:Rieske 2Fe-2S domain-containing protein [Kocuria sp. cx-455]|uniref:Rieske 2Fe-2S domain-containing protein n=1 Tax=unclassified Candidatus Sulfotelmatobacter TaxID=2635724 RepID=UPI0016840A56|nr:MULTISPECIES: Rieske 2Fe-2S domain-containing protein [unclassified Candidatus Sulfotelmatobacter]MBD2761760.1 Rieske 2Fe-2S domain-containing protein [Kocuria sp. cx-116]MBD2763967.1 Rieske 2Fe-2S domain-containing protein [Kocuria sp. cx-455]